jgi:Na+-driven multidrug efflux pump
VLDILLVMKMNLGAGGAALATVISQAVSFISCSVFLIKKRKEFELDIHLKDFFVWDREMLSDLLKLGTPMAIKMASVQISKLFVNSFIN